MHYTDNGHVIEVSDPAALVRAAAKQIAPEHYRGR